MQGTKLKCILRGVILSFFFFFFSFSPMYVFASEEEIIYEELELSEYILQVGGFGERTTEEHAVENWGMFSLNTREAETLIYEGLKNRRSSIDVSSCDLANENLGNLYYKVINSHPELFYANGSVSYSHSNGYVRTVYPVYSSDYTDEDIVAFNEKVEWIISGVDSSWPEIQKILYLHDYLVTNAEYDTTYSKYNAYNALVEGSSVCQGYALAMVCLLNNIDVSVDLITSWELNHAWNMVELDGEYYYIDATWDDPLNTGVTYCGHNNFMVDESGLVASGHESTDWIATNSGINTFGSVITSARYMDYFWRYIRTAINMIGTKAGYLSNGKVNIFDFNDSTTNSYDREVGIWYAPDGYGWYARDFGCLVAIKDVFCYTTEQSIYCIDLNGNINKLYSLTSDELSQGYIYGLMSEENMLIYSLKTEPDGAVIHYGTYKFYTLIELYVIRMYQQCLSREPDEIGLMHWSKQLEKGSVNGAYIAEEFLFSDELIRRNLSNEDFVDALYRAIMGRDADKAGKSYWVSCLDNGERTRSELTKRFVESAEFSEICSSYGIERGIYDSSLIPLERFIDKFYKLCLERNPDQEEFYTWVYELKRQNMNAADITHSFVFSDEMLNRNLSDEEFTEILYRTIMGRKADIAGKKYWASLLSNGERTRSQLTKRFVESTEFLEICSSYGIERGVYDDSLIPLEKFVDRLYTLCLEREPEQTGLYYWVKRLKNKNVSGAQIAEKFFFSKEFIEKGVSDEKYLNLLYNTLMGRKADAGGKEYWMNKLQNGEKTRKTLMNSFIHSSEFSEICENYGIVRGSIEIQ